MKNDRNAVGIARIAAQGFETPARQPEHLIRRRVQGRIRRNVRGKQPAIADFPLDQFHGIRKIGEEIARGVKIDRTVRNPEIAQDDSGEQERLPAIRGKAAIREEHGEEEQHGGGM